MFRRLIAGGVAIAVLGAYTPIAPAAPSAPTKKVADVTSRPDSVSAALAARATGHRVQDTSQSTPDTKVFANPNGTWTAEVADGPVQARDAHGNWHPLDATLAVGTDGHIHPKWIDGSLALSAGGDTTLAVLSSGGQSTTWSWPDKLPRPVIAGNVATYKVSNAENLVVTVNGTGFSEDVVLTRRPSGHTQLELPVSTGTGPISRTPNGGIEIGKTKGHDGVFAPLPFAYDSSTNAAGDPTTAAVDTQVAPDGKGLSMTPDESFLSNPKTVYPVTIDPTFSVTTSGDTWIQTPDYTSSQYGSAELRAGTYDSGSHIARSFIAFASNVFNGRHMLAADLVLENFYSSSCTAGVVYARQITDNWWESSMTWANQPSATTSNQASYSLAHGYSSACAANSTVFNVTGITQSWANGANHFGITLISSNEKSNYTWRRYRSLEYSTASERPYITGTYNSYPATPTAPTVSPVTSYTPPGGSPANYTSSAQPTVSATVSDPDGGTVRATFSFYTSQTGSPVATCTSAYVSSGSTASCAPPSALSNTTYYVKAQAFDGTDNSLASSAWSTFTVAAGTPASPVITCPGYTNGSWSDTVPSSNVACTISAAGSGTAAPGEISYSIDGGSTNTVVIPQSTDPSVAQTSVSVSNKSGPHSISATAITPAGSASGAASIGFGYGSLGLTSPDAAALLRTTNNVPIDATGPPAGSGQNPTAVLKWRLAGSGADASTGWTASPASLSVTSNSGGVHVTGTWASTADLQAASLDTRVPHLVDLEVCVVYSSASTQCSWTSDPTDVLHIAHAFGAGFPTTRVPGGQLALWTGEFMTSATDATLAAGATSLSVGRTAATFSGASADPAANVFGPGWTADLAGNAAGHADAQVIDGTLADGTIAVIGSDGSTLLYQPASGLARRTTGSFVQGAWSPVDDQTSQSGISASVSGTTFTLTDPDGTTTAYRAATAPTTTAAAVFAPGSVTESGSASSTTYSYDSAGRVTRILAPVPSGVNCSSTMNPGCRALDIAYATSTTATGTTPGDYTGQASSISTDIAGTTTVAAKYAYDTSGRLVSVTDPRAGLTTGYGYAGSSNRVSSITPPGLTPVGYTYNSGAQLAQVTRTQASDAPSGTADLATIVYGIPTSGSAATVDGLPDLGAAAVSAWGQPVAPTYGAAVFGPDHPLSATTTAAGLTSSDGPYASTFYTNADGYTLNTGTYGAGAWLMTDTEYDALGNPVRELSTGDIAAIQAGKLHATDAGQLTVYNAQQTGSGGAVTLPAEIVVSDTYATARWVTLADGSQAWLRPHIHKVYDEGAPNGDINPSTGQQYALLTTTSQGVANPSTIATPAGSTEPADIQLASIVHTGYANAVPGGDVNAGWNQALASTTSTVMDSSVSGGASGAAPITSTTTYNPLGQIASTAKPMSSGSDAGTRQSVYYQAGSGSGVGGCDNHPELQGVLCQTGYAGNPSTGPAMITTSYSYNALEQPTTLTETSGSTTRTTTTSYDPAGRTTGTSIAVSGLAASTPVPATTIAYDPTTGLQTTTSTAGGANGGTITTGYDAWGRTSSYATSTGTTTTAYNAAGDVASTTGADGTTTTYTYDGIDRAGNAERRGLVTSVTANAGGVATTITASYNANGSVASEGFAGGVALANSYDTGGELTGRTYTGDITNPTTGTVTPGSPWIGWTQGFDPLGRVVTDWTPDGGASSGATSGTPATGYSDTYAYDPSGRLARVIDQRTPPGAGGVDAGSGTVTGGTCVIRNYSFDANGNRTAETVIPPAADGTCQNPSGASGAVTTSWSHDSADRMTNTGYVYDNLGRVTTLPQSDTPAARAGGTPGDLGLGYYDTDRIHTQTQGSTTTTNTLDAVGRTLTQSTGPAGGSATSTTTLGYNGTGDSANSETTVAGAATTHESYVTGPDGLLGATLTSAGTSQLAVSDPRGGVVAQITVPAGTNPAGLDDWSTVDEYGNPIDPSTTGTTAANPPGDPTGGLGYGFEGAHQRATDSTGLLEMGVRLYNPVTGAFTSPDPVYGGTSTAYAYPQDPINGSDLTGKWSWYFGAGTIFDIAENLLEGAAIAAEAAAIPFLTEIAPFIAGGSFGLGLYLYKLAVTALAKAEYRKVVQHGRGWRPTVQFSFGISYSWTGVSLYYNAHTFAYAPKGVHVSGAFIPEPVPIH